MSDNDAIYGVSVAEWKQGFRSGMPEFAATRFLFSAEDENVIRIAFGNNGPYVNAEGMREATYTHAVTLSAKTAVELARLLLKHYAEPVERSKKQSPG